MVFLDWGVVPRILESAFVCRRFYLGFPLRLFIVLHLLLKNAVTHHLPNSLHSLEHLARNTLLLNAQALSAGATGGLRKVLKEVSRNTDCFQLGQLRFFNWW
jgi:hypothetical protein